MIRASCAKLMESMEQWLSALVGWLVGPEVSMAMFGGHELIVCVCVSQAHRKRHHNAPNNGNIKWRSTQNMERLVCV